MIVGIYLYDHVILSVAGFVRYPDKTFIEALAVNINFPNTDALFSQPAIISRSAQSIVGEASIIEDITVSVDTISQCTAAGSEIDQAKTYFDTAADNRPLQRIGNRRITVPQGIQTPPRSNPPPFRLP